MQLVTKDPNAFATAITKSAGSLFRSGTLLEAAAAVMAGGQVPFTPPQTISPTELDRIVRELQRQSNEAAERHLAKAGRATTLEEQILAVLLSGAISPQRSLNPEAGKGEPTPEAIRSEILSRIAQFTRRRAPVVFALVFGGMKARVQLKSGTTILPDMAEWFAWSRLQAMVTAINQLYSPGALMFPIPDGPLYSPDLADITESEAHIRQSVEDRKLLGFDSIITPVTTRWMNEEWEEAVRMLLSEAQRQIDRDPVKTAEHLDSLYASVDSRRLGLTYEEAVLSYTSIAAKLAVNRKVKPEDKAGTSLRQQLLALAPELPTIATSAAEEIMAFAGRAKPRYDAVNFAIRQAELLERILEGETGAREYVRLSVHAKPYELQPQFFDASSLVKTPTLLPMHGIGFAVDRGTRLEVGPAFHLQARLQAWVPKADSTGRILWYSAPARH